MFKSIVYIFVFVFLVSCNENTRLDENNGEDKLLISSESVELKEKIKTIEHINGFASIVNNIKNTAMREDAEKQIKLLKIKANKTGFYLLSDVGFLFENLISNYPLKKHDQLLFQLFKEYKKLGEYTLALSALDELLLRYPDVAYVDEIQFYRGDLLFDLYHYTQSEAAYMQVVENKRSTFYKQAVYKLGWSGFKQAHYEQALNAFMHLLDVYSNNGMLNFEGMKKEDNEFIKKVFHGINMSFNALAGPASAKKYFSNKRKNQYEYYVFRSLSQFYLKNNNVHDLIDSYRFFVQVNELHKNAPGFLLAVIKFYESRGFNNEALDAKKEFVQRYSIVHAYWRLYPEAETDKYRQALKVHLISLSNYYYQQASVTKNYYDYQQAIRWYRTLLFSFPDNEKAWEARFKLAEMLKMSKRFEAAALQYERVAYDYKANEKTVEAAYTALLMYQEREKELQGFAKKNWHKQFVMSARRFSNNFADYPRRMAVFSEVKQSLYSDEMFDTAFKFVSMRNWKQAAQALEVFRYIGSQNELQLEATKKLVWVYWQLGEVEKAINELEKLPNDVQSLWFAAELSELINLNKQAEAFYTKIVKNPSTPFYKAIEALQYSVELFERTEDSLQATQWRVQLVNGEAKGGKQRTDRTRYLAAKARLALVEPLYERYRIAGLSVPFEDALKVKKAFMDEVIKAYTYVLSYGVSDINLLVNYRIAELNKNMGLAILNAPLPENINEVHREQFNQLLANNAKVFFDEAVKYFKSNADLLASEADNAWMKQSAIELKSLSHVK